MDTPPKNNEKNQQCGSEWFRHWFDSHYYHLLYSHRNDAEAQAFLSRLIEKLNLNSSASILDLACGKGRHSLFLHSKGFDVTGLDLSIENIQYASKFQDDGLAFRIGDMRHFNLSRSFDCVFNLFTSFGYFEHRDDNKLVLNNIQKHLKPKGLFVLDYFNAEMVRRTKAESYTILKEGNVRFDIRKKVESGFVVKNILVKDNDCQFEFEERVQLLEIQDLSSMLREAGLTPIAEYGNYLLENFDTAKSDRLIIIARN